MCKIFTFLIPKTWLISKLLSFLDLRRWWIKKHRSCCGHVNGSWQLFTKCPEASASLGGVKRGQTSFGASANIKEYHIWELKLYQHTVHEPFHLIVSRPQVRFIVDLRGRRWKSPARFGKGFFTSTFAHKLVSVRCDWCCNRIMISCQVFRRSTVLSIFAAFLSVHCWTTRGEAPTCKSRDI